MEKRLRQILPGYLFVVLLLTICGSVAAYVEHNNYTIGDWLINYSGGFVRRGLPGQAVLWAARLLSINPGVPVVVLHTVFYGLFFLFSYLLLRRTNVGSYILLIISPFIFCFQINDPQGGYRKEIMFFALLGFLAYAKTAWSTVRFQRYFTASLLLYPALIMSHEMLAIYLPYVIALGIWNRSLTPKQCAGVALCCIPAVVSFLLCCTFHGTIEQENAVVASLAALEYPIQEGALAWLHFSLADGLNAVWQGMAHLPYALYVPALALSLVAFIPVYPRVRLIVRDRPVLVLVACSVLGSVALAVVALDWGRFLYIHLVAWFILSLVIESRSEPSFTPNGCVVIMIVIWALFFHLPHWPGQGNLIAREWSQVNFLKSLHCVSPDVDRVQQ